MECPNCGSQNIRTTDTRRNRDDRALYLKAYPEYTVYRRRKCLNCGARFTTVEDFAFEEDRESIKKFLKEA